MPVNLDMETLLQHKMAAFALDPDPRDWQAIRKRLDKKRRRRFLWWVFPLAGAMLAGSIWYAAPSREEKASPYSFAQGNTTPSPAVAQTPEPNQDLEQGADNTHPSSGIDHRESDIPNGERSPGSENGPRRHKKYPDLVETEKDATATTTVSEPLYGLAQISADRWRPTLFINTPIPKNRATPPQPAAPMAQPSAAKKIPNMVTHQQKGWYLGAYAGMGLNQPVEQTGGLKAMDQNTSIGSSNTVVYSQGMTSWTPGSHLNLGLVIEKKNKKTTFSIGLGLQRNTWQQQYLVYRDSLQSTGTLYSRATVASPSLGYQQWALEVPVLMGFRVAGRKASSWWIHTGLNNTIVTQLKPTLQQTALVYSPFPGASSGVTAGIPDQPNKQTYLPQFHLGLTYEHAGKKQHWQLKPYMQYSLRPVVGSGQPDIHTLQGGLQWRYFFKTLK